MKQQDITSTSKRNREKKEKKKERKKEDGVVKLTCPQGLFLPIYKFLGRSGREQVIKKSLNFFSLDDCSSHALEL